MKNLKKTLSLVLVAVMMLGILTIGAGAAFTDEADVDYAEAVDVLSAIKVLEGFEDGTFKPDQILTREQGAKIVAYAMIGKTAADALTTNAAPFSDVAATRWSAGYIAFCVDQEIINGYGDGRFGPADTLTGFQFAKMLLTALGYGKNDEFVGSNWTIEVAKLAIPLGIFEGNTEGASNAPCTREAAALYAFNAITNANTVNYSELLGIYYSGQNALVSENEVKNELTLGYQVFGLDRDPDTAAGRSGHYWMSNGVYITGFYSDDTVLGTDTTGTELFNLVKKGNVGFIAATDTEHKVFFNGSELPQVPHETDMYYDIGAYKIMLNSQPYEIKRGTVVELIDTDDEGTKADIINIVEKEIKSVPAAPVIADGYVTMPGLLPKTAAENVIGYEGIKAGDWIAFVEIDGVYHIELCQTVSGKIDSYSTVNGVKNYKIDGTSYTLSELNGAVGSAAAQPFTPDFENVLSYYLDSAGNIAQVSGVFAFDSYGVVLDFGGSKFSPVSGQGEYAKIQMLKADGTVEIFDVVNEYQLPWIEKVDGESEESVVKGELYSYKLDAAGRIYDINSATVVTAQEDDTGITIESGAASTLLYYADAEEEYPTFLTSNTVFFFYDEDEGYSAITGHMNIGSKVEAAEYSFATPYGTASAILLKGAVAPQATADVVFISSEDFTTGMRNNVRYYTYNCFIDGKAGTIDLSHQITDGVAPYVVTENSVTGLYKAEIVNNISDTQVVFADTNYFVDGKTTYNITNSTEVYRVYYDIDRNVVDVQSAPMAASNPFVGDVNLVGYEVVGDTAACVFYEVNYYGWNANGRR